MPYLTGPALLIALLLQAGPKADSKQSWIGDLKARRASLGTTEVRVQGDVVDIRSTSPTAKFGFYRIIDASDPEGLLIRSNSLPKEGGAFRVRARLAQLQPPDGSLLLEELARERTERRPVAALVLVGISGVSLLTLVILLFRAAVEERRYKISPPLWLLPDAGPYGKSLTTPPPPKAPGAPEEPGGPVLKYSPDLEDQDRRQREQLRRRKRNLFQMTLGSLAVTTVGLAWLLISQPAAAQMPAFIFIQANDVPIPAAVPPAPGGDTTLAQNPFLRPDSVGMPSGIPRRDSLTTSGPTQRRRDSLRAAAPPQAPPPAPPPAAVVESVRVTPPPAPAPPPPAPPPPPPEPAPAPNPEVERARASDVLVQAANSLVSAVNGRRSSELAVLLPEALAGDQGRRDRFMKLVKDFSPRAMLSTAQGVELAEGGGQATFAVSFTWRGDFGVERRKTGRFLGFVRREDSGWRFQGARLLDAIP